MLPYFKPILVSLLDGRHSQGGLPDAGEFTYSTNSYVYGLDLSGSLQGAGGIGGLLSLTRAQTQGSKKQVIESYFYLYDANGNVSQLLTTDNGQLTTCAHYEYDPYGNILIATGDFAEDNPIRFSTKYYDSETRLYYYGYRFYSPSLGRWPSRDPLGLVGGRNEYGFVHNSPVIRRDSLGLKPCCQDEINSIVANYAEEISEYREDTEDEDGNPCLGAIRCGSKEECSGGFGAYWSGSAPHDIVFCSEPMDSTVQHELEHANQCGTPCGNEYPRDCHTRLCAEIAAYIRGDQGAGEGCDTTSPDFDRTACIQRAWNGSVTPVCTNCHRWEQGTPGAYVPTFPVTCSELP